MCSDLLFHDSVSYVPGDLLVSCSVGGDELFVIVSYNPQCFHGISRRSPLSDFIDLSPLSCFLGESSESLSVLLIFSRKTAFHVINLSIIFFVPLSFFF